MSTFVSSILALDHNAGVILLGDLNDFAAARNTSASGPFDPRDLNNDGRIDAVDARLAVTACTRARCAVQ